MYRADKLYNDMMAVDTAIKQLKVEDEASLAEYFRLYTELIFNHKWIASMTSTLTMLISIVRTASISTVPTR